MIAGGYTLTGSKHDKNQDNFLITNTNGIDLFVVADGMGGHAAGDVASTLAITLLEEKIADFSEKAINDALLNVNRKILQKAESNEEYKGMGTTLALCAAKDGELFISHIGDSRVYIDKGEGDVFVTKDHSVVQQMVDRGEISHSEAKAHKMKNVITRALGVEENPKIESEITDLTDDTVIIICSDGVSNVLEDSEIVELAKGNVPKKGAEKLCKMAKRLGSTDDITAIVVKVRGEDK